MTLLMSRTFDTATAMGEQYGVFTRSTTLGAIVWALGCYSQNYGLCHEKACMNKSQASFMEYFC